MKRLLSSSINKNIFRASINRNVFKAIYPKIFNLKNA
jgi:hypothetical protein